MNIRIEEKSDIDLIWKLNSTVFPTNAEADLVNSLRDSGVPIISIVAEKDEKIIGHIFFSEVELVGNSSGLKLIGLAPMAVANHLQRKGIGSKLVTSGIEECKKQNYDVVVVLGHPEYYPKFGFLPSIEYGIKCEYDVPDEAFMILELSEGVLDGTEGTIRYNKLFNSL